MDIIRVDSLLGFLNQHLLEELDNLEHYELEDRQYLIANAHGRIRAYEIVITEVVRVKEN